MCIYTRPVYILAIHNTKHTNPNNFFFPDKTLMAKPSQTFVTLMCLLLLHTSLQVLGGVEANNMRTVHPGRRVLHATYLPQTTVTRQCNLCHCSHDNDKTTYITTCCNESTCNDPAEPDGTCLSQTISCGCDEKTCK
uniref:Uncharacterized protein n=1 Tax=Avena sativa TaxID=4498 RepID=A0ACD5YZW4_AVESA